MGKKQFKAESKRLLDMMINSIYTHKEIFLRELISNASDAIDKLYYLSISEKISGVNRADFYIEISADKDKRTLIIEDNGIGMNEVELEKNLGTIALSDSNSLKNDEQFSEISENEDTPIDIIGQFGVGFYSAFMVADRIEVISKKYGEDKAFSWSSSGATGYEVRPAEREANGTTVIISLRADETAEGKEETYGEYLEEYHLKSLIKKYSDYIRYPIRMDVTKTRKIEENSKDDGEDKEPKFETYIEKETINSMIPLWKRLKSSITEEEYYGFYKDKFMDYTDPLLVIHTGVEGVVSYDSLMFVPSKAPYDYYTKDYEKGLQLYSSGVMIMEKCGDLLPDYFSFVRGLVDSQDLSLNISRELLQHDRQLLAIAQRLEKKIQSELLDMQKNNRDKYETFFKAFGIQLKFGIYNDFGMKKDLLADLIMYFSGKEDKLLSLAEYVEAMPEAQTAIYYATGESIEQINRLPQIELIRDQGFDILYGTDEVDEFCFKVLATYKEKPIKHISESDLGIKTSEEDEKKLAEQSEENKDLVEAIFDVLKDRVKEVKLSNKLMTYPVALSSGEGLSLEMEKVMSRMPSGGEAMKADRILEINANHDIIAKLNAIKSDEATLATYANIMYDMAVVLAGLSIEDPSKLVKDITKLIV